MERWVGKVAIVTGASSGIGEAIVESLTIAGMQVVGLARRVERMQNKADELSACKGKLHAVKCDVTCEEEIVEAFEWTTKNVGPVHLLINNAGVTRSTNLIAGDTEKWRTMMDTNVLGLCIATREACKIMMDNNIAGQIIHISSIAGIMNLYFPTISIYGATKHAVGNLADMLRQELVANKSEIKITNINPGVVRTEMFVPASYPEEMHEALKHMPALESQDIADAVLYILGTPQSVNVNEITIRPTGAPF